VIETDPRHNGLRVVDRRPLDERAFSTWSMAFRNITSREVADLPDFSAFARESIGDDLGAHAVAAFGLLETFRLNAV